MTEKITTIAAVEKIEKLIVDLKMAIDSAERFHQVTRQKRLDEGSSGATAAAAADAALDADAEGAEDEDGEEVFARHRRPFQSQQTPEEHELRMRHCQHNRETIDQLNERAQAILNAYQADLKDHHHIDEGARLLEITQALEDALKQGHWQQGLFFRTIGDKLEKYREKFHDSAMLWHARVVEANEKDDGSKPAGAAMKRVYVSLYQAGGQNLNNWQYMLSHLAEHTMGRPAYGERDHIEAFIRSRPVPSNEAYLVADVLEKDIVSGMGKGGERTDNEGRPMLSLNKGAVKLENIEEFVHATGRFEITGGALVPLRPETGN